MTKILLVALLGLSVNSETKGTVGSLQITGRTKPEVVATSNVEELSNGIRYATWSFEYYHIPGNPPNVYGSALVYGHGALAVSPLFGLEVPSTAVAIHLGDPSDVAYAEASWKP